jgi:hypothetical protein
MQNPFGRSKYRAAIFVVAGGLIGAIAWCGHKYLLVALLALPLMLRYARTPQELLGAVLSYHAGATWTLVPGAHVFFGHVFRPLDTLVLWGLAVVVLSLPWIFLRPLGGLRLGWGVPLALAIGLILPTSIESPLTVAGVLFPGTAWLGLGLTFLLFAMIAERPKRALPITFIISLVCHLCAPGMPAPAQGWAGINTKFGGSGLNRVSPLTMYLDANSIQVQALESKAQTTAFPETVVRPWNDATDLFWEPTFQELRRRGQTVIVGAMVTLPGDNRYKNVLMIRGAQTGTFEQREPIPYAMWHPFSGEGVPFNMVGPSVVQIGRERVAPIICYEELLGAPVLLSMLHRPTILLGVANDYWAKGTFIAKLQDESLDAWSLLFWVPTVKAMNE